jgi:hypothetical protein
MYICNSCQHKFNTPTQVVDDVNDEWYEYCPKCTSDDYEAIVGKEPSLKDLIGAILMTDEDLEHIANKFNQMKDGESN